MLTNEEKKVLRLIQVEDYRSYFFQKVKDIKWFFTLKEEKFFNPSKIKFDNNGNALFWNVLDYL